MSQPVLDGIEIAELAQGLKSSRSVGVFEKIVRFGEGLDAADSISRSTRRIKRSLQQ